MKGYYLKMTQYYLVMNKLKFLGLIFLILYLEYFTYNIILNYIKRENNDKKIWIPPMMGLLNNVVFTVNHLVTLYFYTFITCFTNCLVILNSLIYGYYHLLEILIIMFLHFPTNIICIFGLGISLHYINKILKTLLVLEPIKKN